MNDPIEILNAAKAQADAAQLLQGAGLTVTIPLAAQALGISRSHAYALAARDALGVRVIRLGDRSVVLTADLRRTVGLDPATGDPPAA